MKSIIILIRLKPNQVKNINKKKQETYTRENGQKNKHEPTTEEKLVTSTR